MTGGDSIIFGAGLESGNPGAISTPDGRVLKHHFLSYLTLGSGWYKDRDTPRKRITAGTLLWILPGQWHVLEPGPQREWCEYWLIFDGDEADRRFDGVVPAAPRVCSIGLEPAVIEPWRDLCDLWVFRQTGYRERALLLLHQILVEVFLQRRPFPRRRSDGLMAQAEYHLRKDVEENRPATDLRTFARGAGLSYESLRKRFRDEFGVSPGQYALDLRIQRARALLINPRRTVKEIAHAVGFDDPYYFSRIFKKKIGLSPAHYRHRYYPAR